MNWANPSFNQRYVHHSYGFHSNIQTNVHREGYKNNVKALLFFRVFAENKMMSVPTLAGLPVDEQGNFYHCNQVPDPLVRHLVRDY